MKLYVWLDIETGKFSNSWTQEEHDKYFGDKELDEHHEKNPLWKLITYESLSDKDFMFTNRMVIK
jgi:hypothetical protein